MAENVVKKGSTEFQEAKKRFVKLLCASKDTEIIKKGMFEFGEHKGEHLGITSKRILTANLPMPFGCPSLFVNPCMEGDKLKSVIWFCDQIGCICSCCREDMTSPQEEYPTYCPSMMEFGDPYCDCGSSTCDICNPFWDEEPEEWEDDEPYY